MRRISAFILLLVFAVSYTRQISYWECMITGYFQPGPAKCDCSKFVSETKNTTEPFSLPSSHHHLHADELYDTTLSSYSLVNRDDEINYWIISAPLSKGLDSQPDRPPSI